MITKSRIPPPISAREVNAIRYVMEEICNRFNIRITEINDLCFSGTEAGAMLRRTALYLLYNLGMMEQDRLAEVFFPKPVTKADIESEINRARRAMVNDIAYHKRTLKSMRALLSLMTRNQRKNIKHADR